jgi:HlyD family secretion protein
MKRANGIEGKMEIETPIVKKGMPVKAVLIVAGAVILAVVLALAMKFSKSSEGSAAQRATYKVQRGNLDITIEQTGELQTTASTRIVPEINGEGTIVFIADEGSRVAKGDVLVKLDTAKLIETEASQVIEVENANASLIQAEQSKKIQELNNETSLSKANVSVNNAQMDLEKYGTISVSTDGFLDEAVYNSADPPKKGEAYQAFRDAQLEIARAKSELERATNDFADMDKLLEKGFVTKNDFDKSKLGLLEAQRGLESSELKYLLLRVYTHPKKVAQLEADRKRADNELKESELSANAQIVQRDAEITQAQKIAENRQKTLEETRDQLKKMTIVAPEDGLVIYGDDRNPYNKDQIRVGAKVYRGTTLITLPNVSSMVAATKVLEQDVNKAKVGQPSKITIAALPDTTYDGKISKIATVVSQGGRRWFMSSEVKSFDVEVSFDGTNLPPTAKPGMSCNIIIGIDTLKDVLYVPLNAVFKEDGNDVCYVCQGATAKPVPVKVGQNNDTFCEITEGLSDGQDVLLYSVSSSETAGAAAKPEDKNGKGDKGDKGPRQAPGGSAPAGNQGLAQAEAKQ